MTEYLPYARSTHQRSPDEAVHEIQIDRDEAGGGGPGAMSLMSAYRIESDPRLPSQKALPRGRRRPDPLIEIFDPEVVPMLQASPGLRPIAIFEEMQRR
jgi:hypothetical protein